MKRCTRCDLLYSLDNRTRCLYCDAVLTTEADDKAIAGLQVKQEHLMGTQSEQQEGEKGKLLHTQNLLENYFRARTLSFRYNFHRNELRIGKEYHRALIQPIDLFFLLTIPWLIWDIIDSIWFRFVYTNYCDKCGWKYSGSSPVHDPGECTYNREYSAIVKDIRSGEIIKREEDYIKVADQKAALGKRSAYKDLCTRKEKGMTKSDVAVISISLAFLAYVFIWLVFPSVLKFFIWLQEVDNR